MGLGAAGTAILCVLGVSATVFVVVGVMELLAAFRRRRSGYGHWNENLDRGMTQVRPELWGGSYHRDAHHRAPRQAHWPVLHENDSSFDGEQL